LPILAEKHGKENEIWEITKKGIQGVINWEEGLQTRIDYSLRRRKLDPCPKFAERGWWMDSRRTGI